MSNLSPYAIQPCPEGGYVVWIPGGHSMDTSRQLLFAGTLAQALRFVEKKLTPKGSR